MDLFDFAMKMELDGEKYYLDQAAKAETADLKRLLEGLAEDERRHYEIVRAMKELSAECLEAQPALAETKTVFDLKLYEAYLRENQALLAQSRTQQIDVYRAALKMEEESVALYQKLAGESAKAAEKTIFARLQQEEARHADVFETLIAMLNNAAEWVEAAEFNPKDNY